MQLHLKYIKLWIYKEL